MLPPRSRGHKNNCGFPQDVLVGSISGFGRIQFWFQSDLVLVSIEIQFWFDPNIVLVLVRSSSGFDPDPVLVLVGSSSASEFNISLNLSQYLLIWIQVWGLCADLDPKSLYNQSPFHFRKQMGKKILLVKDVSFDVTSNDNKLCISSYFISQAVLVLQCIHIVLRICFCLFGQNLRCEATL